MAERRAPTGKGAYVQHLGPVKHQVFTTTLLIKYLGVLIMMFDFTIALATDVLKMDKH